MFTICSMCCWPVTPAAISSGVRGRNLVATTTSSRPGEVPKRPAEILLAGAALVADGGVEEVDPQLQPPPDDLPGVAARPASSCAGRFWRRRSPCSPCRCGRRLNPKAQVLCIPYRFPPCRLLFPPLYPNGGEMSNTRSLSRPMPGSYGLPPASTCPRTTSTYAFTSSGASRAYISP